MHRYRVHDLGHSLSSFFRSFPFLSSIFLSRKKTMQFFQSSNASCHKYFPHVSLIDHDPISVETRQDFFFPHLSISRLSSEIKRRIGNAQGCESFSSHGAHVGKLRTLCEDERQLEKEEKRFGKSLRSDDLKGERGRNSWSDMPKFLLAGSVSTVISRTVVAPLERIKLECIIQGSKKPWLNIIRWIWVSEGLRGFWKGNTLNLFRMVPFKSINFILYDMYLDHLLRDSEKKEITNYDRLIGGGISGVVATVLCLPLDTIRTRLVAPGGEALGGVSGCLFHMIQNEGLLSLYKGLAPALMSMGPASAVFYSVYDILKSSHLSNKKKFGDETKEIGVVRSLIYGAIAGACAETVIYPLEVMRRQLQLQQSMQLGLGSALVKLIERDGVGSLYAGLLPSTLQVLPSAALSYLFYEMMKAVLKIS